MNRRIAFVLAATDSGPMIVNRLDFDPRHFAGVGLQLLERGSYEQSEIDLCGGFLAALRRTRGDGISALDGGANIGTHTVEWALGMRGWGTVIAVEPQEPIFYALCGNIALNNLSNVRAIKAVLRSYTGAVQIPELNHEREANFGGLSLDGESDPGQKPTCYVAARAMAIDDLGLKVDFIKLDIEGMEIEALAGARRTIARYKPVIVAEHIKCGTAAIRNELDEDYVFKLAGMNIICVPKDDAILKTVKFVEEE